MKAISKYISNSQTLFLDRIKWLLANGGLTEEMYVRLLSAQYHLTKGVQRHLMIAASHPDLSKRRGLRKFLCDFANEEELHFHIALKDLENMGKTPLSCNLDVKLWWSYFDSVILDRPFVRLGGTCVLENITGGARAELTELLRLAPYLNERNTRFLVIHQHGEEIPHGSQVLDELEKAKLEDRHISDLIEGIDIATTMYLRILDWCISGRDIKLYENY